MSMIVTIAAMGVDHHDVATLERLAPDLTTDNAMIYKGLLFLMS
jgi:hypothetical protein